METNRSQPRRLGETPALRRAERAAELIDEHGPVLRRIARSWSCSEQDAEDALQRAAEILLRKGPDPERGSLLAWMTVVTRREAVAVARERRRTPLVPGSSVDDAFDADRLLSASPGPETLLAARERVAAAAADLARLKSQERRAIALQAAGCTYAEIQAITGWTYTKVNRCLAEGRAALREQASLTAAPRSGRRRFRPRRGRPSR
jgi:RNA polymerase sigma factor (sigma-70 family)